MERNNTKQELQPNMDIMEVVKNIQNVDLKINQTLELIEILKVKERVPEVVSILVRENNRLIDLYSAKDTLLVTKMEMIAGNIEKESPTETDAQKIARLGEMFDIHGVSKTQPGVISLEANGFDRFNDRHSS
jgi:hypothetical protein